MIGEGNNVEKQLLEHQFHRCLQRTAASDTVHCSLSAAQSACNLAEVTCWRAAVIGRRLTKLRGIAQLHSVKTGLQLSFAVDIEALEDGDVVLDVSRPAELISSRVTHANVLSRT